MNHIFAMPALSTKENSPKHTRFLGNGATTQHMQNMNCTLNKNVSFGLWNLIKVHFATNLISIAEWWITHQNFQLYPKCLRLPLRRIAHEELGSFSFTTDAISRLGGKGPSAQKIEFRLY